MMKRNKKQDQQIEARIKLGLLLAFGLFYYWTDSIYETIGLMTILIIITLAYILIRASSQRKKLRESGIEQIDKMTGIQFERYLKELYSSLGYKSHVTQASGDFGADLILIKDGRKIVVQAKRYSKNVGIKAVQEVKSAQLHYKAAECWVITNSYFTKAAIELASSNAVKLIDRDQLIKEILSIRASA